MSATSSTLRRPLALAAPPLPAAAAAAKLLPRPPAPAPGPGGGGGGGGGGAFFSPAAPAAPISVAPGSSAQQPPLLPADAALLRAQLAAAHAALAARGEALAAALAERDALRRQLALPGVRAALLGENFLDIIHIVSAVGFAADVSQCRRLCRLTFVVQQQGDTADMIRCSLERQCGALATRAARREGFEHPTHGYPIEGTTQLIRAAFLNNLPRVLQLVQLGAPLDLVDAQYGESALHWASAMGHEPIVRVLLDGKYAGAGQGAAAADLRNKIGMTPLMLVSVCPVQLRAQPRGAARRARPAPTRRNTLPDHRIPSP
jgi:hypothetical protein